jgi:hypothetical protein
LPKLSIPQEWQSSMLPPTFLFKLFTKDNNSYAIHLENKEGKRIFVSAIEITLVKG